MTVGEDIILPLKEHKLINKAKRLKNKEEIL